MADESRLLSGWGGTAPSRSRVVSAPQGLVSQSSTAALGALVRDAGPRGIVARGLGRSYGDPAQNGGGLVVADLPAGLHLDPEAGVVKVGGGLSLHDLIRAVLPHGFFVPVTPGTRMVTIGGAVASDVHGKNHHSAGSFGDHLLEIWRCTWSHPPSVRTSSGRRWAEWV